MPKSDCITAVPKRLYSLSEAAEYLGISNSELTQRTETRQIPIFLADPDDEPRYDIRDLIQVKASGFLPRQDDNRIHVRTPKRPRAWSRKGEWVYFIGNRDLQVVKIGLAVNSRLRLQRLQTGSPFPLELLGEEHGDYELEQLLHSKFNTYRTAGEWFKLSTEIQVYIDQIKPFDFAGYVRGKMEAHRKCQP